MFFLIFLLRLAHLGLCYVGSINKLAQLNYIVKRLHMGYDLNELCPKVGDGVIRRHG